jgi:hypothetical protein
MANRGQRRSGGLRAAGHGGCRPLKLTDHCRELKFQQFENLASRVVMGSRNWLGRRYRRIREITGVACSGSRFRKRPNAIRSALKYE